MEPQKLEDVFGIVSPDYSIISRVDELREQGVEVPVVPVRESKAFANLAQKKAALPPEIMQRKLLFGLEYLADLPEDKTSQVVEATFEILGIDPQRAVLFRYKLPIANPSYRG